MKLTKRIMCIFVCIFAFISATSCQKSHYSATMLVRSSIDHSLSVRFGSLDGSLYESFRKGAEGEGTLAYSASLGEGKLSVSYEGADGKFYPLFSLEGGENVADVGGCVAGRKGARIRILIETDGKCRDGSLKIRFYNGEKS